MVRRNNRSESDTPERDSAYHKLAQELLHYSNEGLLIWDFLPKVARRVADYFDSDSVELWLKEDSIRHYRCTVNTFRKEHNEVKLMEFPFESVSPDASDADGMELLANRVINGGFDFDSPHCTWFGTLWTNDSKNLFSATGELASLIKEGIEFPETARSFIMVPLLSEGKIVGLLQFRKGETGFYMQNHVEFAEDLTRTLVIAVSHQYTQIELRERLKELTCLYGIAKVTGDPDSSFDESMRRILDLLPPAWLYPDIASARITIKDKVYKTPTFHESPYMQSSDILFEGAKAGTVDLAYSEKRSDLDEGPFLSEERNLIDIVAREVGNYYGSQMYEEEKSLLQDQLRHADRLATIGQLAAGVAHELNEPLGNILGFAQLALKTPKLPEQVTKDIDKIVNASLHAREIIKKLMVFARQLPPTKAPVQLNEVVQEGLYFFEARCAKAGVDLVRRFTSELPLIIADAGQLNQVLVNLVVNAVQAMPRGGTLTVETLIEDGHALLIVEDTGTGMSDEVQKQIFVPFFTTKDINEGTGLGLPVVHGIVASHMGAISVKSDEGVGTRFEIRLPLTESNQTEE